MQAVQEPTIPSGSQAAKAEEIAAWVGAVSFDELLLAVAGVSSAVLVVVVVLPELSDDVVEPPSVKVGLQSPEPIKSRLAKNNGATRKILELITIMINISNLDYYFY